MPQYNGFKKKCSTTGSRTSVFSTVLFCSCEECRSQWLTPIKVYFSLMLCISDRPVTTLLNRTYLYQHLVHMPHTHVWRVSLTLVFKWADSQESLDMLKTYNMRKRSQNKQVEKRVLEKTEIMQGGKRFFKKTYVFL